MLKRVLAIYFSGTGTTEKTVKTIAKKAADELRLEYGEWDFTPLFAREKPLSFTDEDLVIFGMPVIAGRVPNLMLKYLAQMNGGGALAVPVVLFGNRNFGDALVELRDILTDAGAKPVAAGAFVGEHSFSTTLGAGRPDSEDLALAESLADALAKKVQDAGFDAGADCFDKPVEVPGTPKPYSGYYQPQDRHGAPIDIRKVKPKTDMSKCDNCGLCVKLCPLGSINPDDVSEITGICMKCCACVKKCPKDAKYFDDTGYIYHKEELEDVYQRRAESKIFL